MKIKTTWKRAMAFLLTASLVCGSGAFIAPSTAEAVKKKKVSLTHKKVSVAVGKTVKLKLKNNKKKVTWTVKSGKKYVSLKSKKKTGVIVKGKKAGKAKVQAKIGKKEYTCTVTVKAQKSNKNNNSSDNNNNSSSHNSGNSVTQPNRPTDISKPTSTPSGNDEMEPEQTVRPTQKPQNTMAPELSPEEQIYADAETINVNSSIYGSVNEDVSTNYYKVIPGTRGRLNMVFAHTYQDSSDGWRLKIHIYKNGQKNLLSETDINLNDNEKYTLPFVGTSADGIYIIEVERNGWSKDVWDEEYTISASFKKGIDTEQEINDTYETATQLTLDGMYSGNINRGEDVDYSVSI